MFLFSCVSADILADDCFLQRLGERAMLRRKCASAAAQIRGTSDMKSHL